MRLSLLQARQLYSAACYLRAMPPKPRIALIHATALAVPPVVAAFARDWPEADVGSLLDETLSTDLARNGGTLDDRMHARFQALADYVRGNGAQAILFTCSAFGPCIEAVARRLAPLPVLKPNEAMVAEAAALADRGGRIGLLASFGPSLKTLPAEFPAGLDIDTELAEGALAALDRGDSATHDAAVLAAAQRLCARGATLIALAQFSLARCAPLLRQELGLPVLSTVDSAVAELRRRLNR